ncbi:MAG: hypothetical protein WKF84_16265 [Pyrinomonadaceae bacterium]
MNRVRRIWRCSAASRRWNPPAHGNLFLKRFRKRVEGSEKDDSPAPNQEGRIPESVMVALAAMQHFCFQAGLKTVSSGQPNVEQALSLVGGVPSGAHTMVQQAKETHQRQFRKWKLLDHYRESFLRMSAGLRVN